MTALQVVLAAPARVPVVRVAPKQVMLHLVDDGFAPEHGVVAQVDHAIVPLAMDVEPGWLIPEAIDHPPLDVRDQPNGIARVAVEALQEISSPLDIDSGRLNGRGGYWRGGIAASDSAHD